MILLENRYGEIMTDNNKTHGYYIVQWDIPPHEFKERTDIFQAGDVVCNAIYINTIKQAHHWYTQITIKTIVCVQHVLTANIDLKNLLCPSNFQILIIARKP